jgi:heat shock protein 4
MMVIKPLHEPLVVVVAQQGMPSVTGDSQVSKRATPSLTGFNDRERLLGDVALAQIRSNAKNTCRNFKHLLGRKSLTWINPCFCSMFQCLFRG